MVFPPYYFGQIAEARHQPGTVSYSAKIQMGLFQATTDEMAQRLQKNRRCKRPWRK